LDNQFLNFLELLASAIHQEHIPKLNSPDWNSIIKSARSQNVFPLIIESASKIPDFVQHPKYREWIMESIEIVSVQTIKSFEFLKVYQHLCAHKIIPTVVKGIVCRELYGELKCHRPSGDEDIIIERGEFKNIRRTLDKEGYHVLIDPDEHTHVLDDTKLDYVQEVTFYKPDNALKIEVHINIFSTENEVFRNMNDLFEDSKEHTQIKQIEGVEIKIFDPTDNLLFLVLHTFKHFLFSGFGIRMVCDILLFQEKYQDEIHFDDLFKKLEKVNALKFYNDLICIGNKYLGFDLTALSEPCQIYELLDDIKESGAFGNDNESQVMSAVFLRSALEVNQSKNKSRAKRLWKTVFPGKEWLYRYDPRIKTKPLLTVPAYFGRIKKGFTFLISNQNTQKSSITIGEKRLELLREYGIV